MASPVVITTSVTSTDATPIKPWRDASKRRQEDVTFEVVCPTNRPLPSRETKPPAECITLTCGNGEETVEYTVPEGVANCSGLLRSILNSSGNFIEQQNRKVHLANIQPHILADVVSFCTKEYEENPLLQTGDSAHVHVKSAENAQSRVTFLFQMKPDTVMDVLAAAHYLQIPSLANYAVSMLAEYATDVPSFEGILPDIVQEVCNRCKPDVLRQVESQHMLDEFPMIDTLCIWKRFCDQRKWSEVIAAKQRERAIRTSCYLDNNKNSKEDVVVDVDWRRGYAELAMEHMLTKVGSPCLAAEDFLAFVRVFDSVIESIKIDVPSFSLAGVQLDSFLIDFFPNLKYLEFGGNLQPWCEQICSILQKKAQQLKGLKMSGCNITDGFLNTIALSLSTCWLHELDLSQNSLSLAGVKILAERVLPTLDLKYLSLAGNKILLKGFVILAESLHKSSKDKGIYILDVSDCRIVTTTNDYHLLEGKKLGSTIPVLDLSGNQFASRTRRFWEYLLLNNTTLQRLNVSRCSISDCVVRKFLPFAFALPSLVSLNLSENMIHDGPIQLLGDLLASPSCTLKKLDLSGNAFSIDGARFVAQGLQHNTSLEELSLSRLGITIVGIQAIDAAITRNPKTVLKRVYMLLQTSQPIVPGALVNSSIIITSPTPTHNFSIRWGGGL